MKQERRAMIAERHRLLIDAGRVRDPHRARADVAAECELPEMDEIDVMGEVDRLLKKRIK